MPCRPFVESLEVSLPSLCVSCEYAHNDGGGPRACSGITATDLALTLAGAR